MKINPVLQYVKEVLETTDTKKSSATAFHGRMDCN